MADEFPKPERDELVGFAMRQWKALFPDDGPPPDDREERNRLRERYYAAIAEYSDRLPRVLMSVCPHCATPLLRSFDPYGFDGPWWPTNSVCDIEEPRACEHFQVLLGAVRLEREKPEEAGDAVKPGPDVPFVVPALLELPKMIAVVSEIVMDTGDRAYPVAYFADGEIAPVQLHQPWCREEYWFTDDEGNEGWSMANDEFDFELAPHVVSGQLRWVDLSEENPVVRPLDPEEKCPFLDLPGERKPQMFSDGEREWLGLPTGETLVPFGDAEAEEMPASEKDYEATFEQLEREEKE